MAMRVLLHIPGEESILCEMETMPKPTDNYIVVMNPRRKDGKPMPTMDDNATATLIINHQVRLASRPTCLPTTQNWRFTQESLGQDIARVLGPGSATALVDQLGAHAEQLRAHGRLMFDRWLELVPGPS